MFGRGARSEDGAPRDGDERLSALLRQWKGTEPTAAFKAAVWRRIRTASAQETYALPEITLRPRWSVLRAAWANAATVAAGIVIGVGLALFAPAREGGRTHEPLVQSHTLAGAYVALVTGGNR